MRDAIRYLGEHSPLPVHCIPNAGLPLQGPDGETIFPETPEQISSVLGEFVERHGVGDRRRLLRHHPRPHPRDRRARRRPRPRRERPEPGPPRVSLDDDRHRRSPRSRAPTLVGERVNSQGSRKAKELLLADDYDGLVQIAEDQVTGGAHVLDVCVALTERQDEDEQMGEVVQRVSLTQPAPIQIDSTEPEVIEAALERTPGRAIVNSINLEAGRDKADRVVPLATAHGAALIALTIDEVGMAKTAERKLEIAKRITRARLRRARARPASSLIFDALTFTLTTGDDEWKPSAVETIEGIRRDQGRDPGGQDLARRLQRLLRRRPAGACGAQLGLPPPLRRGRARPGDGQPEPHHPLRRDPGERARARRRPRLQPPRRRARALHRPLRVEGRGGRGRGRATRPRAWSPRRPCTGTSCAARRRASRSGSTARWRRSARSRP